MCILDRVINYRPESNVANVIVKLRQIMMAVWINVWIAFPQRNHFRHITCVCVLVNQ